MGYFDRFDASRLQNPSLDSTITSIVALLVILGVGKWCLHKLDELEKERLNWQKGTNGEISVAQ